VSVPGPELGSGLGQGFAPGSGPGLAPGAGGPGAAGAGTAGAGGPGAAGAGGAEPHAAFPNPYRRAGSVVEGELFIGRQGLLRTVEATWRDPGIPANLRVVGHYRTGKTSLVRRALTALPAGRPDLVRVWIDISRQESGMDVFRSVTKAVVQELRKAGPAAPAGLLDTLLPINTAVQLAAEWHDLEAPVSDFFAAMHAAGQYGLLVLDEFDRAEGVFQRAAFQLLRAVVSDSGCVMGLITISRRPIESIETDAAGGSILGGVVVDKLYVGMFDDTETDLMLARAATVGVGLAAVRPQIVEYTGRHPFLLDVLCRSLVEVRRATGTTDFQAAYEQVEEIFADQFGRLLRNIRSDGDRGAALLRQIATGVVAPGEQSLELSRMRRMGVVRTDGAGRPVLFSAEFGRYVMMSAVGA
jgi:hypothetical protein